MVVTMNGQQFGLTKQGLRMPRAADFLEHMISHYEAETGETVIRSRDSPLYMSFVAASEVYGKQAETVAAVHDSKDPEVATGFALDVLCQMVGVKRHLAKPSTVELELSGDPGVVVPTKRQVQDVNRKRWTTVEEVTIGDDGTVRVMAVANETGPIHAEANTITIMHTPVAGWLAVTNPAAATPGRDRETDEQLRTRRQLSLMLRRGSSRSGIRGRLLALDFIRSAEVFDNPLPIPRTVAGVDAAPNSVVAYVVSQGEGGTLTKISERRQVAETLFNSVAAGVTTSGNDDQMVVTARDGTKTLVKWSYAEEVLIDVDIEVQGAPIEEIEGAITDLVGGYFDELLVGQAPTILQVIGKIAAVENVVSAEVRFNGQPQNMPIEKWQVAKLGTVSITQ